MDEQVELLRGIWNEMTALNGRVSITNDRLDDVRVELKSEIGALRVETREGLTEVRGTLIELRDRIDLVHSRSVERDTRLGTAFADLALDVRDIKGVVHAWHDEQRLDKAELEERIERLERHVGLEPPP
jgi:hypothetical protein